MTVYQDWLKEQSQEFQLEILGKHEAGPYFKDLNYKEITLEELKQLDKTFSINGPEDQIQPEAKANGKSRSRKSRARKRSGL